VRLNPYVRGRMTAGSAVRSRFERLFRVCDNAACTQRGLLGSIRLRDEQGIGLQGRWYCSAPCFEHAVLDEFGRLLGAPVAAGKKTHRIPIGLLMLSRGVINDLQLKRALALQKEKGAGRIGEVLRSINAVTDEDIAAGLATQWGCPVYPLDRAREFLYCATLLPRELLENGRMLPVHHTRLAETLHVGFTEGVDHTVLYAVEQMLHLKTVPCIVSESALRKAFEQLQGRTTAAATVFDSVLDVREMARTTRSYASQLSAQDVKMARTGAFIWIRLHSGPSSKDILFQAATPAS